MVMMVVVQLRVNVTIILLAIHVRVFDTMPTISVVPLVEIIVAAFRRRSRCQARPIPAATCHLVRPIVAERAKVLRVLVFETAALVGVAAGNLVAALEVQLLPGFQIVNLLIEIALHLLARIFRGGACTEGK